MRSGQQGRRGAALQRLVAAADHCRLLIAGTLPKPVDERAIAVR